MRRAKQREALHARRKRDGSGDASPRPFDGVGNVASGLVYDPVVISLQSNADALSSHTKNNCLSLLTLSVPRVSGNGGRNITNPGREAIAFSKILSYRCPANHPGPSAALNFRAT